MKVFSFIGIGLLFFSCSNNSSEHSSLVSAGSEQGMTDGNEITYQSRIMYEYMRLRNPQTGEIPAGIRNKELEFAKTLPVNMKKSFTWEQRGPINKGGRTRAIAIDVTNENIWLAAGVTGGIWRSIDAGVSWNKVTTPLQPHSVTSLAQDTRPGHENVWYAGTGEHYGIVSASTFEARYSGNGLLKSTDGGITWTELTSTQSNTPQTFHANHEMDFVWRVVTDPSDLTNDVVLAAVYNGVTRSDDGGATWTEVLGFQQGVISAPYADYVDLVVTSTGVFYATISSDGPAKGIFRSDDGVTWANITPTSGFPSSYGRMAIAINPSDENEMWIFGNATTGLANNHALFKYTYISGDGTGTGGTWENRTANLPYEQCYITEIEYELGYLNTQSSFDVHIAVHPADPDVIYIAGTSIWRSTDGFTTNTNNKWIGGYQCDPLPYNDINWQLSYPNHHPDQHYITFLPSDPNVMINVNDGGIYKTVDDLQDSVEWVPLNNGYVTTQFYAVSMVPGNTTSDVVIGGMQDNGTWHTNTFEFDSAWVEIGGGDGMYCAITENEEFYITSTQNGKLFLKEIDAEGVVLGHERIDPEDGPTTYNWCNSLKLDPNNTNTLYWNGRTNLFRLDDVHDIVITGDKTNKEPDFWVEIAEADVDPGGGVITDIEMCKSAPNTVWYGSAQGHVYRLDNANSATPTKVNITPEFFPFSAYVSCIAVDPFDPNDILVTYANYGVSSIFHSKDGGLTYEDIGGNLEENVDGTGSGPAVLWAENYPNGTKFVGTTVGLFTTTQPDSANTVWVLEGGIGNVVINHMDYRTFDGKMIVGTHGNGVYSTNLVPAFASTDQSENVAQILVYPTLAQNEINVIAAEGSAISVYDLNGKKLFALDNSNYMTVINIEDFRKGMYLAVIENKGKREVRKFVKN